MRRLGQVAAALLAGLGGGQAGSASPRMVDRARANDAGQWAATAGGPGGNGTPKVAAFMEAAGREKPPRYRATRRNEAKRIRRLVLRNMKGSST